MNRPSGIKNSVEWLPYPFNLCKCRLRLGSAPPDRVPCPSRMSALELSIRKYAEQPDKSVVRPELGLSFDSLGSVPER